MVGILNPVTSFTAMKLMLGLYVPTLVTPLELMGAQNGKEG
jgi:hypothetical protein